jgi:chromosome segregation ATPase
LQSARLLSSVPSVSIPSLIRSLAGAIVRSFVRSFVRSLARSAQLESSLASLESREDDLANTQKAVAEIQQELDETREAKVAAELSAHSLGAELKVRTKQLGDAQALAARSETQAVSTVKNKLHTAEQREKEVRGRSVGRSVGRRNQYIYIYVPSAR